MCKRRRRGGRRDEARKKGAFDTSRANNPSRIKTNESSLSLCIPRVLTCVFCNTRSVRIAQPLAARGLAARIARVRIITGLLFTSHGAPRLTTLDF